MSWSTSPTWPAVAGVTDIQDWYWLIKPYYALRKRHHALSITDPPPTSDYRYPKQSLTWYEGVIDSIGEVSPGGDMFITDASATDWDGGGDNPWFTGEASVPWSPGGSPSAYKIVIEASDPGYEDPVPVVIEGIISIDVSPSTPTIYFPNLADYVTSNEIVSTASLVGKSYYVIPHYGLWWNERLPEWPNAQEIDFGTITTSTTTGIFDETIEQRESRFKWEVDPVTGIGVMAGKELVTTVDGFMVRITIVNHDDAGNITFAEQAAAPTGSYAIIEPGKRYRLGRRKHMPWAWYRGAGMTPFSVSGAENQHYSLHPDDVLTATKNPASKITWTDEDPTSGICEEEQHPGGSATAMDWDAWSDPLEECGSGGDKPFAHDIFKSLRHLQVECERFSEFFIEKKSYDNGDGVANMTLATYFRASGINSFEGTVSNVTYDGGSGLSTITFTGITLPWSGITMYWTIDGAFTLGGTPGGQYAYSGTANPTDNTITYAGDLTGEDLVGKTFVVSYGWSRFIPREFLRAFGQQGFIPDTHPLTGVLIDPPALAGFATYGDTGVGVWTRKAASTHYFEHTGQQPTQSQDALTVGEYVRWSGDNWGDGIVHGGNDDVTAADPLLTYYARFCVAKHTDETERTTVTEQVSGNATVESVDGQLTDGDKDWLTNVWYGGGTLRTETGSASSGDSTSLSDDTKAAGTEAGAWYVSRRWQDAGWDGPYVGCVIVIYDGGLPYKRVISSCVQDGSGVHFDWTDPLPFSADGKVYEIIEPKSEWNRWQGRRIILTFPDGTTEESLIIANDATTVFFAPVGRTIPFNTSYQIKEPRPGGVWKIESTQPTDDREWMKVGSLYLTQPVGADAVRTGVATPANFHERQTENLPTIVKRYGRHIRGDYISLTLQNQIYDAINALEWTKKEVDWRARADEGVPEVNVFSVDAEVCDGSDPDPIECFKNVATAGWGDLVPFNHIYTEAEANDLAPSAGSALAASIDHYDATKSRSFAYAQVNNLSVILPCTIELMTYAGLNGGDDDPISSDCDTKEFENYGDPVVFRKWQTWTGAFSGSGQTASRKSTKIGSSAEPTGWPPNPCNPNSGFETCPPECAGPGGNTLEGYQILREVAIIKWDMSPYDG